ncbi:YdcF family protein [Candidatus Saccharibacteria bacterium]|nr:YdcF family protein [Candidatus Saccharibacteria bacterium]
MIIVTRLLVLTILFCLFSLCRRAIQEMAKRSFYSYRIISLVGLTYFLGGCIILVILRILGNVKNIDQLNPDFLMDLFSGITSAITSLIYVAFIPAVLFSFFLLIANIFLFIKEGRSLRNALGIMLGFLLVFGSLGTINIYLALDQIMNVHSYFGYHFSIVIENIFAVFVVYFECMMLATIHVSRRTMKYEVSMPKDYLIVLGCYVREDGMPGGVLRKRVETAIRFANKQKKMTGKAPILIFSGGQGADESIPEAVSMKNYSIAQRYEGKILLEDKSTTTLENFKFSKKLIEKSRKIGFVTTDFHIFRSAVYASKVGFRDIEGIGAKSPWYYYYNALIREFIANLNNERKMHAFNILAICGMMTIIIIVSYVFDIM